MQPWVLVFHEIFLHSRMLPSKMTIHRKVPIHSSLDSICYKKGFQWKIILATKTQEIFIGIYFLLDHSNILPEASNLFSIDFELFLINAKQLSKYWLQSILSSDK